MGRAVRGVLPGQPDRLVDPQPRMHKELEEEMPVLGDSREQGCQLDPGQGLGSLLPWQLLDQGRGIFCSIAAI